MFTLYKRCIWHNEVTYTERVYLSLMKLFKALMLLVDSNKTQGFSLCVLFAYFNSQTYIQLTAGGRSYFIGLYGKYVISNQQYDCFQQTYFNTS